jgi:signal transduction histidine kinase
VPVGVEVATDRLPGPVESIAYFVVAEALTNAAKHAGAGEITVRIARRGDLLVVEVADDGVGGADPARGSGLRGLADRVAAIDGRLTVTSPQGGPTVVRAELPCGR